MSHSTRRTTRALLGLALAAGALVTPSAGAVEPCGGLILSTPGAVIRDGIRYNAGDETDLLWFGAIAGGFRVQASTEPLFEAPFYDRTFGPDRLTATVRGLEERANYFRVRALRKPGVCSFGPWSAPVMVVQDQTPPTTALTTEPSDVCGVPVPPPQVVFCLEDEVRLDGTATDEPGELAPSASGAAYVLVTLVNTTPILGASAEPIVTTAQVAPDGTWSVTLSGDQKPSTGTWSISAQGSDHVGNIAPDAVEFGFIVIL